MASSTSSKLNELHESCESTEPTNQSPGISPSDDELHLTRSDPVDAEPSPSLEKGNIGGEGEAEIGVSEEPDDTDDELSDSSVGLSPPDELAETEPAEVAPGPSLEHEGTIDEKQDGFGVLEETKDTDDEAPQLETEPDEPPSSPIETTYQANRDIVGPEVDHIGEIYTGTTTTVEGEHIEINQYFQEGKDRPTSDEAKQLLEKPDLYKEQLALDELQRERASHVERPQYKEALDSLSQTNRLLLLAGPDGCGLHVSVRALSYDLNLKMLKGRGQICALSSSLQISPELLLRRETGLGGAIILFEEGLQTKQSLAVRLFKNGRPAFDVVTDKLRQAESWMILTGPVEPTGDYAEAVYETFRWHNQFAELGMPDMQVLLKKLIEQRCGTRAIEIFEFLNEHFSDDIQSLRTSQDAEHFARRCEEIIVEEIEIEERKRRVSEVLVGLNDIQRDVRRLLEQQLQSDSDVLLAVLLSVLNEVESNLFWQVFDHTRETLELDRESRQDGEEKKDKDEDEEEKQRDRVFQPRKSLFARSRIERLHSIHAEEVVKKEVLDGEEIAYKFVRYIDDRYPSEILKYARLHYEEQIAPICKVLQKPFIEQQQNNVRVRILMAKAIAALAQSNWNGVLAPLLCEWATHPRPYMRATVGYALDQVLKEETYAGNARHLLNEWITAPISGETSWRLKWTVASVCKQIGLTDIEFGLGHLRKLALAIGQRDLSKARSFDEFVLMLGDSAIESQIVYNAIQYSMVVFCLQGYVEPVMNELQKWFDESLNQNPLSLIATALILGILREFGYMADRSRQAAIRTDWASDAINEWSIQVYSNGTTSYIYNRVLQYLLEKLDDRNLFDTLASAIARSFMITRQANEHHIIYRMFLQWADELGAGRHVPRLREGRLQLQRLFLDVCRQLDADGFEDVHIWMDRLRLDEQLPEHVREFARRVCRDLNAPSMRYAKRV